MPICTSDGEVLLPTAPAVSLDNDGNDPHRVRTALLDSCCKSLLHLATCAVAKLVDVESIAGLFAIFPANVQLILLHKLDSARLRRLECLLHSTSEPAIGSEGVQEESKNDFETEFQAEWRRRSQAEGLTVDRVLTSETLFTVSRMPGDARRVYWEQRFRSSLCASGPKVQPDGSWRDERIDLALFADVVRALRLNAREIVPRNASLILRLPLLHRIEVHHAGEQQQRVAWPSLVSVITMAPSLTELGFFHGRLVGEFLEILTEALIKRCKAQCGALPCQPVVTLELVSVKIKSRSDHRQLQSLFSQYRCLRRIRMSSTIYDFDNKSLVDTILRCQSELVHLSLEHNDLADDIFVGSKFRVPRLGETYNAGDSPMSLRHLKLGSNAVSVGTMQTLSDASLCTTLSLEQLELRNNQDIGDSGVIALLPMLASPSASSKLVRLDLRNCHFGIDGAKALFSALAGNHTLVSLDVSQNVLGSDFADVLADLLLANQTIQRLHANYVSLGQSGCSDHLQHALRTNHAIRVLSIAANRLRDQGAAALFGALIERCRVVPMEAIDLSGNLLTLDGLEKLIRLMAMKPSESSMNVGDTGREDKPRSAKRQRLAEDKTAHIPSATQESRPRKLVQELSVLNNDLAGDIARSTHLVTELRGHVETLHSNEWSTRRNVYDDEV